MVWVVTSVPTGASVQFFGTYEAGANYLKSLGYQKCNCSTHTPVGIGLCHCWTNPHAFPVVMRLDSQEVRQQ